jgi:hypothetical protein
MQRKKEGPSDLVIPKFTDLELFLMSGWISYIVIRGVADSIKLRLYIDFKDLKVKVGKPKRSFGFLPGRGESSIHIHHFVFGILLMPFTFIALYWRFWPGPILVGIVMALIGSEVKELVLMNWSQ